MSQLTKQITQQGGYYILLNMNTETNLNTRVSIHEAVCEERYLAILARIKRIEMILIGSFGAIFIMLLSLVAK